MNIPPVVPRKAIVSANEVAQTKPDDINGTVKRYEAGRAMISSLLCKAYNSTPTELRLLTEVDLSSKGLESLYGLSDACPDLRKLDANDNDVTFLTGVPWSVMHLNLANNRLSNLTSFKQLRDLRVLNISGNQIQDLAALSSLLHLVELRADYNQIANISGLNNLENLVRLSIRNNQIAEIELADAAKFKCLEYLDVSHNHISSLSGIGAFPKLETLIADDNEVSELRPPVPLRSLVSASLLHNKLTAIDAGLIPNVRSLKLDGNRISTIHRADRFSSLEVLGLNDQNGTNIAGIEFEKMPGLRHLQIADNVLTSLDRLGECSALEVLDVSSCSLRGELSKAFTKNVPNLRLLNLAHNKLTNISNIKHLQRLRRLILFGNNLSDFSSIMRAVRACSRLEVLDLRENPVTEMYYAQLPSQLSSSFGVDRQASAERTKEEEKWMRQDDQYKRTLADTDFVRRLCYRATLVDLLSQTIRILDGIPVTEREKRDAGTRVAKLRQRAEITRGSTLPTPNAGKSVKLGLATPASAPAANRNMWTPGVVTPGLLPSRRPAKPKTEAAGTTPASAPKSRGTSLRSVSRGSNGSPERKARHPTDHDPRSPHFWISSRQASASDEDAFIHSSPAKEPASIPMKDMLKGLPELPQRRIVEEEPDYDDMSIHHWKPVSYPIEN